MGRETRTTRRAGALGRGAVAAGLLWAGAARAQAPAAPGLGLDAVLRATLAGNADIQTGRAQVEQGRGALLSTRGTFDPLVTGSVMGGRDQHQQLLTTGELGLADNTVSEYALKVQQATRLGIVVQPDVSVSRSAAWGGGSGLGTGSVGLGLSVPLLRDRWGRVSRTPERAARTDQAAAVLALRGTVAGTALQAAAAYWSYVAAQQRLQVYRESEARAQRMVDQTRVLVQHDERPASDLNQLLGNVATKRITRYAAEQAVVEARRTLGLAMGADPDEIAALPAPSDDFPAVQPFAPDAGRVARLQETARASRPDLAQADRQEQAAQLRVRAAEGALKPRLDLAVHLGYSGIETGAAVDRLWTPLYRNVPGISTTVQLQYELPVAASEARGLAVQRTALLDQQRIAGRDLARRVGSGVVVAAEALGHAAQTAQEAESAVELYRVTVENEARKHELGASTLFDVIAAEDGLTSARLAVVASRLSWATSLAQLRYETGTLADAEDRVDAASLLTPP